MFFSILGDSISTYSGYQPDHFAVYYDKDRCLVNGLRQVNDTWWCRVIQYYQGDFSFNNSYSGSRVSGKSFPAANSIERLSYFKLGKRADYLLVYIGFNDFGYGVKIRGLEDPVEKNLEYFDDAYDALIENLKQMLPDTTIIFGTLLKTYITDKRKNEYFERYIENSAFDRYNDVIRQKCRKHEALLADLAALSLKYETLDGSHPTVIGHKEIADAWITVLEREKYVN